MAANLIRLVLGLLLGAPAFAGEQTFTVSTPVTAMSFTNVAVDVPQFIPTLGRLDSASGNRKLTHPPIEN